ncbi:hypothetical protein GTS_51760 [Gandjariella thermophila]|uniref:Uncharacterized protein n=1 Tax=Gandjariella thermophila TaxID=1931992 RepID=A0A4D4JI16_9PSEU|nr:hypothetical protein GTS_51760 [Gandjariella thermophila]
MPLHNAAGWLSAASAVPVIRPADNTDNATATLTDVNRPRRATLFPPLMGMLIRTPFLPVRIRRRASHHRAGRIKEK